MKQQGTTLVQHAFAKINGFKARPKKLEKKILVSGKAIVSSVTTYDGSHLLP